MKKKKELKVLAEFSYNPIGSYRLGNPYTIAYCYTNPIYKPAVDGEFIVKGGNIHVEEYIKKLHIPLLVFRTFWRYKMTRGGNPHFINFDKFSKTGEKPIIHQTNLLKMGGRYFYRNTEIIFMKKTWLYFRRFPRKWLSEYDEMLLAGYSNAPIHYPKEVHHANMR